MSRSKRKRPGQESDAYNVLKLNWVRIWPSGVTKTEDTWVCWLAWVDIYTIGVMFDTVNYPDFISIIYKDSIRIDRLTPAEVTMLGLKPPPEEFRRRPTIEPPSNHGGR